MSFVWKWTQAVMFKFKLGFSIRYSVSRPVTHRYRVQNIRRYLLLWRFLSVFLVYSYIYFLCLVPASVLLSYVTVYTHQRRCRSQAFSLPSIFLRFCLFILPWISKQITAVRKRTMCREQTERQTLCQIFIVSVKRLRVPLTRIRQLWKDIKDPFANRHFGLKPTAKRLAGKVANSYSSRVSLCLFH